jgi:RNA polymerase sigma-70 factor (ECF subfamily)
MEAAVETLPPSLRAAFVLRDIQGLSTQEAAEALDITESALKVRLHRARLALRERLAGYLAEQPQEIAV